MLTQILQTLKDIPGFRFYFITTLLFLMFLITVFEDKIKQMTFNPQTLVELKDKQSLQKDLEAIKDSNQLIKGYVFFVYQPKQDSYYKTLVASSIRFINERDYFKAMPLNAQKYLNFILIDKEYVLLECNNPLHEEYIKTYNSDYIYVYNVHVKETIAEVIFTFDVKPTKDQMEKIAKSLRTVKYYLI